MERKDGPELDFKLFGERAFTLDYPNLFDRIDGRTGSGIWLHAVPDNVPLTRGSRGCVVVRNDTIKALTQYIKLGRTPLVIVDKMTPMDQKSWADSNLQLTSVLQNWRQSWQTKNMPDYMAHYSDRFQSQGMNKKAWEKHKAKLAKLYQSIVVNLSKPLVLMHGNRAVARFIQQYKSDLNADLGEKTLHLVADGPNGSWRIISETWTAADEEAASEVLTTAGGEIAPTVPASSASQPLSSAH
jgi:murein L,D-transpeptidase YafK